ncbi:hypothetical protein V5799_025965 [Amblyomma americanum]|uniref:Uncharacterized protein n=1 Tax=Amblyomma americanum TaxID=6943 RepID=A0AAQ4DJX9_AMBAM
MCLSHAERPLFVYYIENGLSAAYYRAEEAIATIKRDADTEARTNAGQEVYLGAACMVEEKARERVPYTVSGYERTGSGALLQILSNDPRTL